RCLAQLAVHGALPVGEHVLDVLLGDRRAALDDAPLVGVGPGGTDHRPYVDAFVVPEALVFDGDDCVTQLLGHLTQGHRLAVLLGMEGGEQAAVRSEDLGRLGHGRTGETEVGRLPCARRREEGERDDNTPETSHTPLSLRYRARPWITGASSLCGRRRTCPSG